MKKNRLGFQVAALVLAALFSGSAWAHVTPNMQLAGIRETVAKLLPYGQLYVKDIRLNEEQKHRLDALNNWKGQLGDGEFKFFITRDGGDRLLGALVFMNEFTYHGPVVVAVAMDANGKVADATVTDVPMEPLEWVSPLLRSDYLREFKGKTASMELALGPKWENGYSEMTRGYALFIANAVKRSAQLFDMVFINGSAK
ncbi:MAG: hypothetical protein HY580_01105 [Nitrospinae bacterium]|nr:hypothetical protein [Nitrospinota bacterium]